LDVLPRQPGSPNSLAPAHDISRPRQELLSVPRPVAGPLPRARLPREPRRSTEGGFGEPVPARERTHTLPAHRGLPLASTAGKAALRIRYRPPPEQSSKRTVPRWGGSSARSLERARDGAGAPPRTRPASSHTTRAIARHDDHSRRSPAPARAVAG